MPRLIIVGVGNMGRALAGGVLDKDIIKPSELLLIERNIETCANLEKSFPGAQVFTPDQVSKINASSEDIVFLAVKPRDLEQAAQNINALLSAKPLIISILAGTTVGKISKVAKDSMRIIRAMPNLGMQIGQGVTILLNQNSNNAQDIEYARKLFVSCGSVVEVASEELVDAGTAISGSGPAYLCLFIESIEKIALEFGFDKSQAALMVHETLTGTLGIIEAKNVTAPALRNAVTSPGGTTEAALREFEKMDFHGVIAKSLKAAFERARELAT